MSHSPPANAVKLRVWLPSFCNRYDTIGVMSSTPDEIIRHFISLLVSRDIDQAATMVSSDFEYDNVPMGKAFGPQGLRDTLTGFFGMCTGIDWEIVRQTSTGNTDHAVVLNERNDRFEIHGRWTSLPVAGVFEINNGLITLWRDYFDRATLLEAMSPPPA
jgi:limonene-1,2-epoxide hydrolase